MFFTTVSAMVLLRCAKCGSDAGFLIETQDRKTLNVQGRLPLDRIKKTVLVTCTYCNNRWDHAPIIFTDKSVEEAVNRERGLVH